MQLKLDNKYSISTRIILPLAALLLSGCAVHKGDSKPVAAPLVVVCNAARAMNTVVNAAAVATIPIDRDHLFCGEVTGAAVTAKGFHSRPGGANPVTVNGTVTPVHAADARYNLNAFNIVQNGNTRVKAVSTMFPDNCSEAQVLNSIAYAYNTSNGGNPTVLPNQQFNGDSSPMPVLPGGVFCLEGGGAFNIRGYTSNAAVNPTGLATFHIRSAFPF